MKNRGINYNNGILGDVNALESKKGIYNLTKVNTLASAPLFDVVSDAGLYIALDHRQLRSLSKVDSPVLATRASDSTQQPAEWVRGTFNSKEVQDFSASALNFTWYDQSGNGRNFTTPTVAKSPKLVSGGVPHNINGRQVTKGNASAQASIFLNLGTFTFFSGSTLTIILLCTVSTDSASRRVFSFTSNGQPTQENKNGGFNLAQTAANTLSLRYTYNTSSTGTISIASIPTGAHVVAIRWNGTSVSMRIDNGIWTTNTIAGSSYNFTYMYFLSNYQGTVNSWSNEALAAFYLFSRVLSEDEISYIERDLMNYYKLKK